MGPATVRPLGVALAARGWSTQAPDLRGSSTAPADFIAAAARWARHVDVVIGHSGAGALLPAIADLVAARYMVFVDAVLPEPATSFRPSEHFVNFIDTLPARDGLLPAWHRWWPEDRVRELLPDETVRRAVLSEVPSVPRSFYNHAIELPGEWWSRPAAYLRLSPAYDEELARAGEYRWPTGSHDGRHLDLVTCPDEIADMIVVLVGRVDQPG